MFSESDSEQLQAASFALFQAMQKTDASLSKMQERAEKLRKKHKKA